MQWVPPDMFAPVFLVLVTLLVSVFMSLLWMGDTGAPIVKNDTPKKPTREHGPFAQLKMCVLLDVVSVALVIPLLPYHALDLGMTTIEFGWVSAFYGALQVGSGPLTGIMSQRIGKQRMLVVSMLGTGVSYAMLALTSSKTMFIVSRIPVGLLRQSMMLARTIVGSSPNCGDHLADLSALASLAFVVGPVVGMWIV
jgi:MFS family permease